MQTRTPQFYLFVLLLGALSAFGPLSIDMYLPAFPAMAQSLGVPQGRIEMSLASFFIGLSLGQLMYGPLSDRYGRKKPLYTGIVIYIAASAACALAATSEQLILFRFLQALGSCAGMVIARAMVRDLFDHRESAQVFSLLMLVMGVAPILAPLAGGYVLVHFDWRVIFWFLTVFSATILIAIGLLLPETRSPDETVRFRRVFHTYFDILRHRSFLNYTLAGAFAQAGLFAYITGSSFIFIQYFGIPPEKFGWVFGLNAFGLIATSQGNAWLLRRGHHPDKLLQNALLAMAFFSALLLGAALLDLGLWPVMLTLFPCLATLGIIFPNTGAGALEHQKHRAGAAASLNGMIQFSCSASAASLLSMMHAETPLPMAGMMAGCGIVACALFIGLRRYRPFSLAEAAPPAEAPASDIKPQAPQA